MVIEEAAPSATGVEAFISQYNATAALTNGTFAWPCRFDDAYSEERRKSFTINLMLTLMLPLMLSLTLTFVLKLILTLALALTLALTLILTLTTLKEHWKSARPTIAALRAQAITMRLL